jgi:acyl transferase domain-containing protein/NADPH-dependent curcumin reductase CurA/acyl carrier protein
MAIDTACSSSLVAVHLACQSLGSGECSLALAGGANVVLDPEPTVYFSRLRALSPTGRCHAFSADADGYVRAEGAGVVVLERLSDARRNGHPILALIRGTAVNQDGRSNGLTAPNGPSQEMVIREALLRAGVAGSSVGYLECHGTGTPLGDPIEVQAAASVLGEERSPADALVLGSLKSNIGHTEGAAGVAGLTKAVLSLQHERIPQSLHFTKPNPHIPWDELKVVVAASAVEWPRSSAPRRAGVSSFGFSGTNAHVVLEEAPVVDVPSGPPSRTAELVVVSAKTPAALEEAAARLRVHVETHAEQGLGDLAYSLATTRAHHEHRLSLVVSTRAGLVAGLDAVARGDSPPASVRGEVGLRRSKQAWLFTGQGAQTLGMGRGLAAGWPVFREALDEAFAALDGHLEVPLREVMWAEPETARAALLDQTGYTQPALFALEVALAALWRSWGVEPDLLAGHSIGELAAAYVAGVFTLEDAARLVAARGRLMQSLPAGGAMVSIAAPESLVAAEVSELRPNGAMPSAWVAVAAVNGPESVVISGAEAAVSVIAERFARQGVRTKRLSVSHAFHSPLMEPMLTEFRRVAEAVTYRAAEVPLVSNVTGALAGGELQTAEYWVNHVRAAVRFGDGVRALHEAGATRFLELGPQPTLLGLVPESLRAEPLFSELRAAGPPSAEPLPTLLASLRPPRPESEAVLEALGGQYAQGGIVDWKGVFPRGMPRVELPTYAWQRTRHWIASARSLAGARGGEVTGHPLLGVRVSMAGSSAVYETSLSLRDQAWLGDHRVAGHVVVPAAGLGELIRAAAEHAFDGAPADVSSLVLQAPMVMPEQGALRVQVLVTEEASGLQANVYSQAERAAGTSDWRLHCTAEVRRATIAVTAPIDLASIRARCTEPIDIAQAYVAFEASGLDYGPSFQGMRACFRGPVEALAEVSLPAGMEAEKYGVHPALLDAAFHAVASLSRGADDLLLPFAIERLTVHQSSIAEAIAYVRRTNDDASFAADVTLVDPRGQVLVEVVGLRLRHAETTAIGEAKDIVPDALFRVEWLAVPGSESSSERATLPPGRWLVVASEGDALAQTFVEQMLLAGASCRQTQWARLHEELPAEHVICVWGGGSDGASLALRAASEGLGVVQTLAKQTASPRMVWVTTGAVATTVAEAPAVASSPLWGLGRTVMAEHPELGCTLVDVEASVDAATVLVRELCMGDDESLVAWRGRKRHVARLVRAPEGKIPKAENYALEAKRKGKLDELAVVAAARRAPAGGEVEIAVRASGLNFRDVVNVLGIAPGAAGPLGGECAGVIVAVGTGVVDLAVGDAVMALAPGSFQRFVTVDARLVAKVPPGLSMEQAATVPCVFLTAWYALHDLGGLKAGERLLVHAAAGGVGMAAVQLAQWIGAEVLGTASPPKWEVLKSLGVSHLASSRDLAFVETVRAATGGEGVDVVLNALAGEFIDASLSLLREGGRFIEMGKTDIRDAALVNAAYPGIRYRAFDLVEAGPERLAEMLGEIVRGFASGHLRALPVRTFPVTEAEAAFRLMAQGRSIGKLALIPPRDLRTDGTVLITGGLGALGFQVARWLVDRGVKHLVLTSRRGLSTPGAREAVAGLEALGAIVATPVVDVTDREALAAMLAQIPAEHPLRGIVHAAGVLDDGMLSAQSAERFAHVMSPKVLGASNLDTLTRGSDLDFFVLFSSAAGTFGSAGQGPYAAANAFLDALAARRRAHGLPAQSLAWGLWVDAAGKPAGLAGLTRTQEVHLTRQGLKGLSFSDGIALLANVIQRPEAELVLAPLNLRTVGKAFDGAVPPLWRALVHAPRRAVTRSAWAQQLAELPPARRLDAVLETVRAEVARVLSLAGPEHVTDQPLKDLGLDSLMAVELRNALGKRAGTTLPATLAFDFPTPVAIAKYLLDKLVVGEPRGAALPLPAANPVDEPIAIVGFGCRFPGGVDDPESFWRLLDGGVDAVGAVPRDRWDAEAIYDPDSTVLGKTVARSGGFVRDIDQFDASFFGISPREAVSMDPQQRLLLETSWEALERSGIAPDGLVGTSTGVFVGLSANDYGVILGRELSRLDGHVVTGNAASVASGRISYVLGLNGPSMTVDTACSSSLVAVHLACQALRHGECSLALAGGVTVMLTPGLSVEFSRLGGTARDGRCKSFSAAADGAGWSEGCGIVVLERLSEARRNGHPVLAVIRGSAINQDGRSNGLTSPSGPSQTAVIRRALAQAQVSPSDVHYVECHGTGTSLGDPIEVQALEAVLGEGRDSHRPLVIGSVKSNFGHTQSAAGVAGMIKVVLAVLHGKIPKHLHFDAPSPHIPWDEWPVKVAESAMDWPRTGTPRIAGVSSFGIGGTNAHVVLAEAPVDETRKPVETTLRAAELVVLSAKSPLALDQAAAKLRTHLHANAAPSLGDVAYTLATCRTHHAHRLALTVRSCDELSNALAQIGRGELPAGALRGQVPPSRPARAWLFTGQGAQTLGMGQELYADWSVFREALEQSWAALDPYLERPLRSVVWAPSGSPDAALLDQTAYAQAALFALEVSLSAVWRSFGFEPAFVLGHSVGEISAAHVAGVFSLEDAARMVAARGRLMQALPTGGAMVAIAASESAIASSLVEHAGAVSLAAVNGPEAVVISGDEAAVLAIAERFRADGVATNRLSVSHAFHSARMEPMLEDFRRVVESVTFHEPALPIVSNVTGQVAGSEIATVDYWVHHVRACVRFAEGVETLYRAGITRFVELGPKPTLLGLVANCLPATHRDDLLLIPSLRPDRPSECQTVLEAVGTEYASGDLPNWGVVFPQGGERVELPTYPWQRERFWSDTAVAPPKGLFRVEWPLAAPSPPASLPAGSWVIVADAGEPLADGILERMTSIGRSCVCVEWAQLHLALPAENVVCVWRGDDSEPSAEGALRMASEALAIVQALSKQPRAPRLWWVTTGAVMAHVADAPAVAQASIWGLARSVRQERPDLRCKLIDAGTRRESADLVFGELSASDDEDEVALRSEERRVPRLVRMPAADAGHRELGLDGTVLITGGLGALGLHVARWLARRGVRHLLLTSRRGDRTPMATEAVTELSLLGAEVTVAAVDVTDKDALADALAAISPNAPLRGVVHAAGILDDAMLSDQTTERFARVMNPKVAGACHLDALTRDADLDFFWLFGSVAATFGSAGQTPYAAANACLDALAARRRALGLRGQCFAWGPWASGGMAASLDAAMQARMARRGTSALSTADAIALLESALARQDAQLVLAALDVPTIGESFDGNVPPLWRTLLDAGRRTRVPEHRPSWAEELGALSPSRRRKSVLDVVRAEAARVLALSDLDAIAADRPLKELGLNSLTAVELRNALGRRAGSSLKTTLAFDFPTPAAIARYLLEEVLNGGLREPNVAPATTPRSTDEPVAIVGIGCRYPGGVVDPESFWRVLEDGVDAVTEVPPERWDIDRVYDPNPDAVGKMSTRSGGFVRDIDRFDAAFFGISAREATSLDPQQRLLLETSWEALERAGIAPDRLEGTDTSVFVGLTYNEYAALGGGLDSLDGYVGTGNTSSVASGRISYVLGLQGPSMTVDTACSSSLVTIHLACQTLRNGESSLALAGGVALMLTPTAFVEFSRLRGLAEDGRCKAFSAAADGVGWSEGCGMLVLERLSDAVRNGHRIHALIRGSAVNQDGRSNGMTAPNGPSQERVIRRALGQAGVRPAEVRYVECHGTGTAFGDPIEVQALGAVLAEGRVSDESVIIGSVKTNLGHTQAAAGVAGVIKVALSFRHGRIPRSLHFDAPNPRIPWDRLPVRVASQAMDWPRADEPWLAGVSAFGISGTNAHIVLQAPPVAAPSEAPVARASELVVLSAKTETGLHEVVARLRAHLDAHVDQPLGDVAASVARSRAHHEERLALTVTSRAGLESALDAVMNGSKSPSVLRGRTRRTSGELAWLFTGQGAQTLGMGQELYAAWPIFRDALEATFAAFDPHLERPLRDVMWAKPTETPELDQTVYTQPALFALESALSALWSSWGMHVDFLMGHSIGELSAAYVAGVFSLDDAARLVAARGRLMQALPRGGAMVTIAASEAEVIAAVEPYAGAVSIAAINAPSSVVISGEESAVVSIAETFGSRGVRTKRLSVSHAFHSPLITPMLGEFRKVAESVTYRTPQLPLVSNVSGEIVDREVANAEYWVNHVREAVRFVDGVASLHRVGVRTFVELGPKPTLLGLVRQAWPDESLTLLTSLHAEHPEALSEVEVIQRALARYYTIGGKVEWNEVFPSARPVVEVPAYPWQRQRYWLEPPTTPNEAGLSSSSLLGTRVSVASTNEVIFDSTISVRDLPWLADHRVAGQLVVPGAALMEYVRAAAEDVSGEAMEVRSLALVAPLVLPEDGAKRLQIVVSGHPNERVVKIYGQLVERSATAAPWTLHCTGDARRRTPVPESRVVDLQAIHARCTTPVDCERLYSGFAHVGLEYGPAFQGVRKLSSNDGEALAEIALPAAAVPCRFGLHPALLDAAFQTMGGFHESDKLYVPFSIDRFRVVRSGASSALAYVRRQAERGETGEIDGADITLVDREGRLIAEVVGLRVRRATAAGIRAAGPVFGASLYRVTWPLGPSADSASLPSGTWAVFAAEGDARGAMLVERLLAMGASCVRSSLFDTTALSSVDNVVCLWSDADMTRVLAEGLALLQAAVRTGKPLRLWWVTENAVPVTERQDVTISVAPLWGLARSAMQEHPEIVFTLVDVDSASSGIGQVFKELSADDDEREVAWREGLRHVARLASAPSRTVRPLALRTEGTVLVTGGLGALGLLTAEWLAKRGVRHLVLCSRRGRADTPGASEAVVQLERHGAVVTVETADISNAEAVSSLIARIPPEFPLRGVVHAAGVRDDGMLEHQDTSRLVRMLAAKAVGAAHLDALTRDADLDFFVLFSSAAATLGSAGQGPYAAANAFLDALAERRRSLGLPAHSMAWGPWAEGGMAVLDETFQARWDRRGIGRLSPAEGLALFERALAREGPHFVIAAFDLRTIGRAFEDAVPSIWRALVSPFPRVGVVPAERGALARTLRGTPLANRLAATKNAVREQVAHILPSLDAHKIPTDEQLMSLGMDSMFVVEFRNRLKTLLDVDLPVTLVFEHPTINDISRFVFDTVLHTSEPAFEAKAAPAPEGRDAEEPAGTTSEEYLLELAKSIEGLHDDDARALLEDD